MEYGERTELDWRPREAPQTGMLDGQMVWSDSYGYGFVDRCQDAVGRKLYAVKFRNSSSHFTRWLFMDEFEVIEGQRWRKIKESEK